MSGYDKVIKQFYTFWKEKHPGMSPVGSHYIKVQNKYDFEKDYNSYWLYIEIDVDDRVTFEFDFDEGQQDTELVAVFNQETEEVDTVWKDY